MFRIKSIRTKLTLLALAAIAPLLALVVFEIRQNFDAHSDEAKQIAVARAREIGARIDEMVGNVDALLIAVSQSLRVVPADEKTNDAILTSIKAELPAYFHDVRVSARDGSSLGHFREVRNPVIEGRVFRDAVEQRRFAAGDATLGYDKSGWIVGFGRPVLGKDGDVVAVASASIRMDAVQELLRLEGMPPETVITVLDDKGIVLAHSRDPANWVGKSLEGRPDLRHALSNKTGAIEAVDADGVTRVSGFATAKRVPWLISVGAPASAAYATARATAARAIWLAILCVAASALLATLVAARIARPVRRLRQDVAILAAGNLAHRSGVAATDEVGRLAGAFNEMAQALEVQEDAREHLLQRFELVSRAANDVIWDWDLVTDEVWWSTGLQTLLGYRTDDVEPRIDQGYDRIHPDDRQRVRDSIRGVIDAGGQVWDSEYRTRKADGSYLDIYDRGYVLRDERGKGVRMIGAMQDVTARKRAVAELRASEERYRYLFESNPHPMWIYDVKTLDFLAVNQTVIESYGYTIEDFGAMTIRDIRPAEDVESFDAAIQKLNLVENSTAIWRHQKKDGTIIDVEVVSHPFTYGDRPARLVLANDVTARVRAQGALQESERRYRNLFDLTPLPMWVREDESLRFLEVNDAALKTYGYTRSQFLAMTTWDIRPPEDFDRYQDVLRHRQAGQSTARTIGRHHRKDGTVMDVEVASHALTFYGRSARLTIVNDITESKRAEEALARERNLLRALIDNVPEHIYTKDRAGRYLINNASHLGSYGGGGGGGEVAGETVFELFPPDVAQVMHADDLRVMESGVPINNKQVLLHDQWGMQCWRLISKIPLFDNARNVTGLVGIGRDITEQKRAEEALRASEHQLRLVTDNIPAMIAYHGAGLICRYANRRYEEFYGLAENAAVGKHQQEILGEAGYDFALPYLRRLLQGESVTYQRVHAAPGGAVRDIEVTGIPDRSDDGSVSGFYVMIQDITERKRTEQALRDSEERLRTVANNVPALIGYIDAGQRYRYVNRTYEDWYSRPASDYFGRTVREVVGEELYARLQPRFEAALRGETVTVERRTGSVGTERYARFTYAPHFGGDGKVLGFYVLGYDITERRKAENAIRELNVELERRVLERTAQLVSANKELEAFSYSVSHDLRAPLRSIDGFSQALLEEYEEKFDEQGRDFLHRIRKSSQRMAQLIDDLLGLARVTRTEMARAQVDLSALATDIAGDLQRSQPSREVEFGIAPALVVNADPNLMRVMLDNLLANAWKFSAGAEHAKIEFGETTWRERHVYFVRDNGAGFDMAYADKLFGAFQRLHNAKDFQGTGIGLATVQRIVRRHGGDVWGEGEVGKGATFYFSLEPD